MSSPEEIAHERAPDSPTQLTRRSWWGVLKRTVAEFSNDNLTDWAAALTYYGVLSIFPGLLVLLSAFNLLGPDTAETVIQNITQLAPANIRKLLTDSVEELQRAEQAAGILAVVGLLGALWTASGYVSAFMRAANAVYDVPEGRPIWKTVPIRLAVTVVCGTLLSVSALAVVLTGQVARYVGNLVGLGDTAVTVWDVAKWPVLIFLIMVVVAILYWASPNVRQSGFRWVSPGGVLAVLVWLIASAGFGVYLANFASYNKTYGTLGGVIGFLVWLWISNIALLLGAEFDAELERGRAIEGGLPPDQEPFIPLRDDRKVNKNASPGLGSP
ncbi:MAG TPA: YihY/virulence factor BrkB family protein [Micromonosporaceae bacterium]|nr:YihY/virulence factor BrkB family protein [Micromonosporaceae bacterium]